MLFLVLLVVQLETIEKRERKEMENFIGYSNGVSYLINPCTFSLETCTEKSDSVSQTSVFLTAVASGAS